MSLDGLVAGPNVSTEQPMGEGAEASVHDLMFSGKSDAEGLLKDRCDEEGLMGKVTSEISMSLDGFITVT